MLLWLLFFSIGRNSCPLPLCKCQDVFFYLPAPMVEEAKESWGSLFKSDWKIWERLQTKQTESDLNIGSRKKNLPFFHNPLSLFPPFHSQGRGESSKEGENSCRISWKEGHSLCWFSTRIWRKRERKNTSKLNSTF